jgi:hypothetical protein
MRSLVIFTLKALLVMIALPFVLASATLAAIFMVWFTAPILLWVLSTILWLFQ